MTAESAAAPPGSLRLRRAALRFVLLVGVMSMFADFTYEGSRSIIGPYLAIFWFFGSALIGLLYGYVAIGAVVAFALVAELAAIPIFVAVMRRRPTAAAAAA